MGFIEPDGILNGSAINARMRSASVTAINAVLKKSASSSFAFNGGASEEGVSFDVSLLIKVLLQE